MGFAASSHPIRLRRLRGAPFVLIEKFGQLEQGNAVRPGDVLIVSLQYRLRLDPGRLSKLRCDAIRDCSNRPDPGDGEFAFDIAPTPRPRPENSTANEPIHPDLDARLVCDSSDHGQRPNATNGNRRDGLDDSPSNLNWSIRLWVGYRQEKKGGCRQGRERAARGQ